MDLHHCHQRRLNVVFLWLVRVEDLHRECTARNGENVRVEEISAELLSIESGTRDDKLEVIAFSDCLLTQTKQYIRVNRTLRKIKSPKPTRSRPTSCASSNIITEYFFNRGSARASRRSIPSVIYFIRVSGDVWSSNLISARSRNTACQSSSPNRISDLLAQPTSILLSDTLSDRNSSHTPRLSATYDPMVGVPCLSHISEQRAIFLRKPRNFRFLFQQGQFPSEFEAAESQSHCRYYIKRNR